MSLYQLIQNGGYASTQEAYDSITSPTIINYNKSSWTFGSMQAVLGLDLTKKVAVALQTVGSGDPLINSAYIAISTVGIRLDTDERQSMIETVGQAGGLTDTEIQKVKELGKKLTTPWQSYGLESAPTMNEIEEAWNQIILEREWAQIQNEIINPSILNRADLVNALRQGADLLERG